LISQNASKYIITLPRKRLLTRINQKLNILVLDFHNKPTKPSKKGVDGANSTSVGSGRKIPQDIALSILFQSTDFYSLKSLVLVNQCFFNAFQSYRVSIMDAVLLNMFGTETADHAIALAGFIDKPSSVLSKDGTIVLVARGMTTLLPSGTIKRAQFVHQVVNKWVELYEMRQMWLNVPKKKRKAKARCDKQHSLFSCRPDTSYVYHSDAITQKLSSTERTRLRHALVLYWIYSFCAHYPEKHQVGAFSMPGMKKSGLCNYFSDFEFAELMAMFRFFEKILQEACDDCQISGDDDFRT
jgi:hypothetical protein